MITFNVPKTNRHLLLTLSLICTFAASSCKKSEEVTASKQPTVTQAIAIYSNELVRQHPADLVGAAPATQTSSLPLSYMTYITAKNPTILTREGAATNKDVYDYNLSVTEHWKKMWCTAALKSIMQKYGVSVVVARLVDTERREHSLAVCGNYSPPTPPPQSGAPMADEGGFTTTQICKAAMSVEYGREPGIMAATVLTDHVQVKYERPSDGKSFSYRCRLNNGQVLLWDDSLVGARWYGSEPNDSKLIYFAKDGQLRIQDVIREEVNREKVFSRNDLM